MPGDPDDGDHVRGVAAGQSGCADHDAAGAMAEEEGTCAGEEAVKESPRAAQGAKATEISCEEEYKLKHDKKKSS